jgi:hypothetical protein
MASTAIESRGVSMVAIIRRKTKRKSVIENILDLFPQENFSNPFISAPL